MNRLTFPRSPFATALGRLWSQSGLPQRFHLGLNPNGSDCELLVARASSERRNAIELRGVTGFTPMPGRELREPGILLEIGRGALAGQAAAVWLDSAGLLRRIDELALPGAGMQVIPLGSGATLPEVLPGAGIDPESRTAGALGSEVMARLAGLAFGVVGVGRTGTRVARALTSFGPRRLVLIDPDVLESHNLAEVDGLLGRRSVGRKKVQSLAEGLREQRPELEVTVVEGSVSSEEALAVLRRCDVLFCCADHDGARLATTTLAALFHKVLIDIATGVHRQPELRVAADVRVLLPGSGCLMCVGGLPDEARARAVLASPSAERTFRSQRNWRAERAGSLASLNQVAVGLAMRALEDVVAERVRDSVWAHLEFDAEGRCRIEYPGRVARASCACGLSGLGMEGLRRVPAFLQGDQAWG